MTDPILPGVNGTGQANPAAAPDPFNPAALRLSQDFASTVGVKKALVVVPCRKPNRQEFVRVRAGAEWRLETGTFEDKINRETYLVNRELWSDLMGEIQAVCLFLCASRQNDIFFWPAKLPSPDGRQNAWHESAIAAARIAEEKWVRVSANMNSGMYDVHVAGGNLSEPEWPELPFPELLRLCFKDRFIQSLDHPVLRALRGEA